MGKKIEEVNEVGRMKVEKLRVQSTMKGMISLSGERQESGRKTMTWK